MKLPSHAHFSSILETARLSHELFPSAERKVKVSDLFFSLGALSFCIQRKLFELDLVTFSGLADAFTRLSRTFRIPGSSSLFRIPEAWLDDSFTQHVSLIGPLLDDLKTLSLEELGTLFERLQDSTFTQREGVVYTPPFIASRIVGESLDLLDECSTAYDTPSILDPACGSGIFLLESLRYFIKSRGSECVREILTSSLYGVDRDPAAVDVTRTTLLLFLASLQGSISGLPDLSNNIVCGNSLIEPRGLMLSKDERALIMPFSWDELFPEIMRSRGFRCIIGNPPYGLSRNDQIGPLENQLLQSIYSNWKFGKVNKYLAFMARSYELLAPGGVCSFIVPNAWLGIKTGRELRLAFLRDECLRKITVFETKVFEEPSLEPVIFLLKKGGQFKTVHIETVKKGNRPIEHSEVPVDVCLQNPASMIPTRWHQGLEHLFAHLDETCLCLDDRHSRFKPLIALQAYSLGRGVPPQTAEDVKHHVHHSENGEDQHAIPYLEGADVKRFSIKWSGRYLRHGPWLAEYQEDDRYACPRVLVREITGPSPFLLSSCATDEAYLYNRSILHIIPSGRGTASLAEMQALSLILNSRVASCVLAYRGRKTQRRLFPKIVNDDLKMFPIPRDFESHVSTLASWAEELQASGGKETIQDEADRAVSLSYGMDSRMVEVIRGAL